LGCVFVLHRYSAAAGIVTTKPVCATHWRRVFLLEYALPYSRLANRSVDSTEWFGPLLKVVLVIWRSGILAFIGAGVQYEPLFNAKWA